MSKRTSFHRPTVLLAMGWFVHEINVGVARYARSAGCSSMHRRIGFTGHRRMLQFQNSPIAP